MNTLHLGADSEKPSEVKGQIRLYQTKFCPSSHRIRLMLSYKKIPYNIINININNIPKWYLEIHPEGEVPALVNTDGKVVVNSTAISNYLDEKYTGSPLYHEETKTRDLELLDHFSKLEDIFLNCVRGNDNRPFNEIVAEISSLLVEFEKELKARGTIYFGGSQPGIIDIVMWPWVERRKSLSILYGAPTNFNEGNFSHLIKWVQEMKAQPFVQENECSYEKYAQFIKDSRTGVVDFDSL